MLAPALRETIINMWKRGMNKRAIGRAINVARNTVRQVLQEEAVLPEVQENQRFKELAPVLTALFARCRGNVVRIQEILQDEYGQSVPYSTLCRWVHEANLRGAPKRSGEYTFEPGLEMQHDTSPHRIILGDKPITAQCASLVLAYSRLLYMQYYPRFTRFEAKAFLREALCFMEGSCQRCVIDNTSVVLAGGAGSDAVIAPEMTAFGRTFGFHFIAHAIMHSDRKGRVERPFSYIENNFLAGRTFNDFDDLNGQAKRWCRDVSNKKPKRILKASPETVFIKEKPFLIPLPATLPPIFEHYIRRVDTSGYVNLDTNRYSVPERLLGKNIDVYKHLTQVKIYHQRKQVAVHERILHRQGRSTIKGHHSIPKRKRASLMPQALSLLLGVDDTLDAYIADLKKHVRGRGSSQFRRLLTLKQTYPEAAFTAALKQAQHYGLYDLSRLEDLILKYVAGEFFNIYEED